MSVVLTFTVYTEDCVTSDKARFEFRYTVEYRRIVGRLISKVTLFKPSIFVSSYGTELMFSFVVWFNMCGDRSHFLFTKFSFTETS